MQPERFVTCGLVLRETVTRDAAKILTVLTPDRGRLSVIARGARRKGSRVAAACQRLAYSEMTLYEKGRWSMLAAAATIATLAVPALYEQSILFRFAVILLAGLFGVPGLACGALLILAMACGSDPFGYDYLYPLMPPGKAALRDGFVRAIWSRLAQKGEVLPRHAKE